MERVYLYEMTAFTIRLACGLLLCGLWFPSVVAAQPAGGTSSFSAPWSFVEVARRAESHPKVFGPLRLDMPEAEVREKVGAPDRISPRSMMMATDEYSYTWDYSALGVTVFYTAFDESSSGTVMAIRAKAPCDWTAFGGLRVGMSIDDASQILQRGAGGSVSSIGSVGTEMAGLLFELSEIAVVARLEMGAISVLYVGPNLP